MSDTAAAAAMAMASVEEYGYGSVASVYSTTTVSPRAARRVSPDDAPNAVKLTTPSNTPVSTLVSTTFKSIPARSESE